MGNGLASFATGFGGGYLNAQRQSKLDEERQADRAMRQQEFDARMGEVNDKKNLRLSLADAVRPVTVESGAGGMIRPETMDNRDVGLAENASQPNGGLSLANYRIKDKTYNTPALADIAAAAQNTPEAIDKRLGLAWATNGKPLEAKQYAAAAVTQKSGEMDLADKVWRRKIGVAMRKPGDTLHDGLATLFTESEFGPMAGKKLKAVASTDRKTVNYNMINPDGTLTPTDLTFSNDQEGVTKAGYALDGVVKPEDRYTNLVTERKAAAQQAKDAAVFDETKRHNLAVEGGAAAGKVPPGYRKTVDGNLEGIPGGPATTIKPVVEKPLNDGQSKALLFGSRMREADKVLAQLKSEGTTTSVPGSRTFGIGSLITSMSPENSQMLDQAKRDFMSAALRRESGAAISEGEYSNADKQYFPQIGDEDKVIAQKAANRQLALNGILLEVPERHRNSLQPQGAVKPAASSGAKDGVTSVSKSGKPIVMRGGNWEYQ